MCLINFSRNFVFVHIPKTGGSSITRMLSPYTSIQDLEIGGTPFGEGIAPFYEKKFGLNKHSNAEEIEAIITKNRYHKMWTFTICRNPFFRTLSLFRFLKQWKDASHRSSIEKIKSFEDFVNSSLIIEHPLGKPQTSWILNSENQNLINEWFKLENLYTDIPMMAKRIGITKDKLLLPKTNETVKNKKDLKALANRSIQEKIIQLYEKDFNFFNYSKELDLEEIKETFHTQTNFIFKLKHIINKPKGWL